MLHLLKRRAPAEKECGSGGTPSKIRRPFVCTSLELLRLEHVQESCAGTPNLCNCKSLPHKGLHCKRKKLLAAHENVSLVG